MRMILVGFALLMGALGCFVPVPVLVPHDEDRLEAEHRDPHIEVTEKEPRRERGCWPHENHWHCHRVEDRAGVGIPVTTPTAPRKGPLSSRPWLDRIGRSNPTQWAESQELSVLGSFEELEVSNSAEEAMFSAITAMAESELQFIFKLADVGTGRREPRAQPSRSPRILPKRR